jgi:hypothetical protein
MTLPFQHVRPALSVPLTANATATVLPMITMFACPTCGTYTAAPVGCCGACVAALP